MKHIFEKGTRMDVSTLVLFHGTGGTERSLLTLAKRISPESSVLSLRGNILENGMPRFFRRLTEGVFDEKDLIFRTKEVYEFLGTAAAEYGFDRGNLVAIGYSNGANIAGSLLFHYQNVLRGAILHHPMVFAAELHDAKARCSSHFLWRSQRKKRTDSEDDYTSVVDLAVGFFI